ncbi:6-phosphogluconolactonase [Psittacicella melopsittaci]|uniref:6-phosphogluconolactonase n=1 Tax=Psittacicella melopsittaci TaxID=2028576 RepID=A0A3A1YAW4_9GAMM|nr:6-phosphogluconolactonase [Psittacicella melopsittaci]RIY33257.1 6-phosphogluconolactonase [Psittacicella melopsittaci]
MTKTLFQEGDYSIVEAAGDDLLSPVANKLLALSQAQSPKHISLFGGSTVFKLFAYLEKSGLDKQINWDNLHLWWNDERLVDHGSPESNYGELNRQYLSKLPIKEENIHPIQGLTRDKLEFTYVEAECKRMISLVHELVPANAQGIPSFDLIILGIGDDGHTASLFPAVFEIEDTELYVPAFHPLTMQPRISQSLTLINAAKEICFIATGENKARVLSQTVEAIAGVLILQSLIRKEGKAFDIYNFSKEKFGNSEVLVHVGLTTHTTMYLDPAAAKEINVAELEKMQTSIK